jgi:hypothetical protein
MAETFGLVLGFPRSGTTLLSRLLDAHPSISCPPETCLTTACARFLHEDVTDGLPIGVLAGVAACGVAEGALLDPLRDLVWSVHRTIATGKPVMVEKSALDIFHLERLESLFAGRAKFILVRRNPLDVVASVRTLSDELGVFLDELRPWINGSQSELVAYAKAWVERNAALDAFAERHSQDCVDYRFEDLLASPKSVLQRITDLLGAEPFTETSISEALQRDMKIGLGDWKVYQHRTLDPSRAGRWRSQLSRKALASLVPILAQPMRAMGYEPPPVPPLPNRKTAVKIFQMQNGARRP